MNHKNHELTRSIRSDTTEWLDGFTDPIELCLAQGWLIEQLQHHVELLAKSRVGVAKQLRQSGLSVRKLAATLGISSSRVEQITR